MSHIHIGGTIIDLAQENGHVSAIIRQDEQHIASELLHECEEDMKFRLGEFIRTHVPGSDQEAVALEIAMYILSMSHF